MHRNHPTQGRSTRGILIGALGAATLWVGAAAQEAYPSKPVKIVVGMPAGTFTDLSARLIGDGLRSELNEIVHRREPAGRRHQHRDAERRARAEGRLHAAAVHQFERHERQPVQGTAVRRGQGLPADRDDRLERLHPGGDAVAAGVESQGADRLRQEPSGRTEFRIDRLGNGQSSRGRDAGQAGRHQGHDRVLQRLDGGHRRRARRPDRMRMFAPASTAMPQIQAGKLKAIAVTSTARTALAPDVPTMAEAGLPGYEVSMWNGLFAPAGTPPEVVDRLAAAATKAVVVARAAVEDQVQRRRSDRDGAEGVRGLPAERTSADGPTRSRPPASSRNNVSREISRVSDRTKSAETLADRKRVEDGYALVNAMWKTQGAAADAALRPSSAARPRACRSGSIWRRSIASSRASTASIAAAIATGRRSGSRPATSIWSAAARRWRAVTRRPPRRCCSRRRSAIISPATCITTSAACCPRPGSRCCARSRSTGRRRRCSRRRPIPLEMPYRRHHAAAVPAPAARRRAAALRVLIGGANSNMINMHAVSEYYLDRGMATIGLDGPGQGEFRARTGRALRVEDYDRALSAVADWLQRDSRRRRQAYRHLRARDRRAAGDPRGRPRQAVQGGGGASRGVRLRQFLRAGLRAHAGVASAGDVQLPRREDAGGGDAPGARAAHARRRRGPRGFPDPVGVLGRRRDHADDANPRSCKQRVKGPVEIVTFPGKGHGGPSRLSLPLEADWMRDKLVAV